MMSRYRYAGLGVAVALFATSATVIAQPRKDVAALKAQIVAVERQVAELNKLTVGVPTLSQSVQTLSVRIVALSNAVDTLRRQQRTIPDAVKLLDSLGLRVRSMRQEIALLRTKVASLEQTNMPPPAADKAGAGASYDDGFVFSSADKRYRLKLSGVVQARYAAVFNGDLDTTQESGFSLARARVIAGGGIGADIGFRVELELSATPVLFDGFFDYRLADGLKVRAGAYKTPFTRSFISHGSALSFPQRPAAVDAGRLDRDLGVSLMGSAAGDKLGFVVGVQNGAGRSELNDNVDMLFVGRADLAVLGKRIGYREADVDVSDKPALTVGVGAAHDLRRLPDSIDEFTLNTDVDGNGERDNVQVVMASADAIVRYRGFEWLGELTMRHERWGTIFEGQTDPVNLTLTDAVGDAANRTFWSVYSHASYFVMPKKLLVGLRAGFTQLPFLGLTGRASSITGDDRVDIDAMVAVYKRGYRFVSLMYSFSDVNPGDRQEHRVLVDASVRW